jgi:hypothetical protein
LVSPAVHCLDSATLPAGAVAAYAAGGTQSWVTWVPYGGGAVVHVAYDWSDTAAAAAAGTFQAW